MGVNHQIREPGDLSVLYTNGSSAQVFRCPLFTVEIVKGALYLHLTHSHRLSHFGDGNLVFLRIPEEVHGLKRKAEEKLLLSAVGTVGICSGCALANFLGDAQIFSQLVNLEIFPVGRIKQTYLRLLGMKIGNNSLVGGVIKDPCLAMFGDNVTMGEYAIMYAHIHNMQHETIYMETNRVGNNCVIGAGAIIMPGAVLEDDVVVAAGALVTKGQRLSQGKMYGGIPAKEIIKKPPQ